VLSKETVRVIDQEGVGRPLDVAVRRVEAESPSQLWGMRARFLSP
jgi:hypothetical protein